MAEQRTLRIELEARLSRLGSWEKRQARLGGLEQEARFHGQVSVEWELMRNFAEYREEISSMLPCLAEYLRSWQCQKAAYYLERLGYWVGVTDWLGAPLAHTADSHEAILSADALNGIVQLRRGVRNLELALSESWYRDL